MNFFLRIFGCGKTNNSTISATPTKEATTGSEEKTAPENKNKYKGFDVEFIEHSGKYFPRHHGRYLYWWTAHRNYTTESSVTGCVYSHSFEGAMKIINEFLELHGVGVTITKYEDFEIEFLPSFGSYYPKYKGKYLYHWSTKGNYTLECSINGCQYARSEQGAIEIIEDYKKFKSSDPKIIKLD